MTTTATAVATTFRVDLSHSEANFQVRHLLGKVRGRFSDFSGEIEFDPARPEEASVAFTIQAGSIDTNQPDRDKHLRSDDFFAVDQFPTLTFVSRAIKAKGGAEYDVTGDLSIRGVTRSIVLPVSYLGSAKDPWGNQRLAFEAETTINRKDYGLNWNAVLETGGFIVGDDVRVSITLQAVAA